MLPSNSRLPCLVGLALLLTLSARGALVITGSVSNGADTATVAAGVPVAGTYSGQVVNNDLVNAGQPTLSSSGWLAPKAPFFQSNTVNDGLGHPTSGSSGSGTYLPATFGNANQDMPQTWTATLNLATNTFGYDLRTVRVFAGWVENGASLANLRFEVLISLVGSASFSSLGTFQYTPFDNTTAFESGASMVTLQNDSGSGSTPFATGVDEIRFVFLDHGFNPVAENGTDTVDGTVLHEIDVIGVASVPEPTTTLLGGFGLLLLLGRRR
ncbi:PEP-CTERM sorting domain-containing protein [Luteolibacter ambystomatis]|uniref:PEP-CTERM sorting domain-containing protein n=1 Tax=Luteolibacter ambystomatis TaxID=2824561 RepID=A0A975GA06_9BACT|nr:PEP-CTERM sorting domain-containing protein [Luteolibacter ambystomatis]QUE51515.1 PEP-CTERM sorting domain-containing protein [Luteolibacter ambystomatis]